MSDIDEQIELFKKKLRELGYSSQAMYGYSAGAREYYMTGREMTKESVSEYYKGLKDNGVKFLSSHKAGAFLFVRFCNGEEITRTKSLEESRNNSKLKNLFHGCDDDCFNCKYDECYKPSHECKSIPYEEWTGYATREGIVRTRREGLNVNNQH